jgi:methionyl-tRNA formyltransferase
MRIALAGSGLLAGNMLEAIRESTHEVVAIIQNGRKTKGWRRRYETTRLGAFLYQRRWLSQARREGLPIVYIDKMTEAELAPLKALELDLVLVGGFSIILKKPLLELPRIGCINTHSSLLPKHRGPNPFSAVILAGESETGVTFHAMDETIDTGGIIEQHRLPLKPTYCAVDVHRIASKLAGEKVVAMLDRVEAEGLQEIPQDPSEASYEKNLTKKEAVIQWDRSAAEIDRLVRACFPHCMARFHHEGKAIFVNWVKAESEPADAEPGTVLTVRPRLRVATGDGTITLMKAFKLKPFPWVWPGVFGAPQPGDRLDGVPPDGAK